MSKNEINDMVGRLIEWCNRENKETIVKTIKNQQNNKMLQAYELSINDFYYDYHFYYTNKNESWKDCGPINNLEKYSEPSLGWMKLALKVQIMY